MTAQRPTEESNPHRKEVKDRPTVRTLNVVFVDIKTNYKPTETFQLIHNVPRATLRGGIRGETIRLLEHTLQKKKKKNGKRKHVYTGYCQRSTLT